MLKSAASEQYQQAIRLHQAGRLIEARSAYESLLVRAPRHADALHYLGLVLCQLGDTQAGVTRLSQAIELTPHVALYHNNLGTALKSVGRVAESIDAYRRSIQINPRDALTHSNLGNALAAAGQVQAAEAACRAAIQLDPKLAQAHTNLGNVLDESGKPDEALAVYRRSVQLNPGIAESHCNLGKALLKKNLIDDAAEEFSRSLACNPRLAAAYLGLGAVKMKQGLIRECIDSYSRAAELNNRDESTLSFLAFLNCFDPDATLERLLGAARKWANRLNSRIPEKIPRHLHQSTENRRLRIGYVSPDFRDNVMGWLISPILEHHNRQRFEIHCFSSVLIPDPKTSEFQTKTENWHEVKLLSDDQLAGLIRELQIDILVDLAVHTPGGRLGAFAERPAPVQATFLAYCGTTGLDAVDFVLSDRHFVPESHGHHGYNERVLRLPTSYWCYRPGDGSPSVAPLPAMTNRYVTFGSLNQVIKLNDGVLTLWSEILQLIPSSRLVLMAPAGLTHDRIRSLFARNGVNGDRVGFVTRQQRNEYLCTYQTFDIALDPFPYGGGNTTADALWMGVPVITRAGETAVSRAGLSILSNVGLQELVTFGPKQYVRVAVELANDLSRLKKLRSTMRQRMTQSPLMDEAGYVAGLEQAYRTMWDAWCSQQ